VPCVTVKDMDEVLMLRGTTGLCPDCGDERVLLPIDEDGFELCCTDCDAAVVTWQWTWVGAAEETLAS
jgi:hypothetical protein